MKYLRFLAVFLALGFVTYQIVNLNDRVKEEAAMSSLIEVYTVSANGNLALRARARKDSALVMNLKGRNSGNPDKVSVVSKDNKQWWEVEYTKKSGERVSGFAYSKFLELSERIQKSSLVWDESSKTFSAEDTDSCETSKVKYDQTSLVALDLKNSPFMVAKVKDRSGTHTIANGALLNRISTNEARVLSNPVLAEEILSSVAAVGDVIELEESVVSSLQKKSIRIPELSKYIDDVSTIADEFEFEGDKNSLKLYNCCFEGKACQRFAKLKPKDDESKEMLLFPYKKTSVYSRLSALEEKLQQKPDEKEEDDASATGGGQTAGGVGRGESRKYTNYEDYFLGPRSVKGRRGGKIYRLNVQAGGGTVKNGPCGSYHYNPENFGGLVGGDRYIKKEILGCFLATLQVFRREHPNARVQWGDISRGDRTSFRPDHSTHTDGRDIDVRPIRSDKKLLKCYIGRKANRKCYSRRLTKAFIEIAQRFGGDPIYFNDKKIYRSSSKIKRSKGHYDHFHIRYSRTCTGVTLDRKYCPTEGFN